MRPAIVWCLVVVVVLLLSMMTTVTSQAAVRLVDGPSSDEGRLEVFYRGQWGTVCDDLFGTTEGHVACRQLGYRYVTSISTNTYPTYTGLIYLDDVDCSGDELYLDRCNHQGWGVNNCEHNEDVNLQCTASQNGGEFRLVGGVTVNQGRLEVYHLGQWGTVCDDSFTMSAARVFCRELGFSGAIRFDSVTFGPGSGRIWLDDVSCLPTDDRLTECSHSVWGDHNCVHSEDVSLWCEPGYLTLPPNATELRLEDGSAASEGRVEVYRDGQWKTFCQDYFDDSDATVMCRILGYLGGGSYLGNIYSPVSSLAPVLEQVDCEGNEYVLEQCMSGQTLSDSDCSRDVSIRCSSGFSTDLAVQLVGATERSGRVEVYQAGWGRICADHWTVTEAQVVCRMLGFTSTSALNTTINMFTTKHGYYSDSWSMAGVSCVGHETSLSQCTNSSVSDDRCDDRKQAAVLCPDQQDRSRVRLSQFSVVQPSSTYYGLVEVLVIGSWRPVCGVEDSATLDLICNALGFIQNENMIFGKWGSPASDNQYYSNADVDLTCSDSDQSLTQCIDVHHDYSYTDCTGNYLGVICAQRGSSVVRLVRNGVPVTDTASGYVQVYTEGAWHGVCSTDVGDSNLLCRGLGLQDVFNSTRDRYSDSNENTVSSQISLDCYYKGFSSIGDCLEHGPLPTCDHHDPMALRCTGAAKQQFDVTYTDDWSSDTGDKLEGYALVNIASELGGICKDNIYNADVVADVICRELGYQRGQVYFGTFSALEKMWLRDVECLGSESHLYQCFYNLLNITDPDNNDDNNCHERLAVHCEKDNHRAIYIGVGGALVLLVIIIIIVRLVVTKISKSRSSSRNTAARAAPAPSQPAAGLAPSGGQAANVNSVTGTVGYNNPAYDPSHPPQSGSAPQYGPPLSYPAVAPYQPGSYSGYPQAGTAPGYPQAGTAPGYPQAGTAPGYPQAGTQAGYPSTVYQIGQPQTTSLAHQPGNLPTGSQPSNYAAGAHVGNFPVPSSQPAYVGQSGPAWVAPAVQSLSPMPQNGTPVDSLNAPESSKEGGVTSSLPPPPAYNSLYTEAADVPSAPHPP